MSDDIAVWDVMVDAANNGCVMTSEGVRLAILAKDTELKAYKANSFCAFCAGKEEELKEQTRKSDVIIAAKDAAMWRKDREIDSLRARIEDVEGMAGKIRNVMEDQKDWDAETIARAVSRWLKEGK